MLWTASMTADTSKRQSQILQANKLQLSMPRTPSYVKILSTAPIQNDVDKDLESVGIISTNNNFGMDVFCILTWMRNRSSHFTILGENVTHWYMLTRI
jgi:hypothetical protein